LISFDTTELNRIVNTWHSMNTSIIKPKLRRSGDCYRIRLVEESDDDFPVWKKLDNCCIWAENQLKNWPDCNRKAWDMWDFKHQKDAEKFITMFYLRWAL
jgi:hypothetical protein